MRRKAVHLVDLICEALASQDGSHSRSGEAELLSPLFKPLSLLVCPPHNSAIATAQEERKVRTPRMHLHPVLPCTP